MCKLFVVCLVIECCNLFRQGCLDVLSKSSLFAEIIRKLIKKNSLFLNFSLLLLKILISNSGKVQWVSFMFKFYSKCSCYLNFSALLGGSFRRTGWMWDMFQRNRESGKTWSGIVLSLGNRISISLEFKSIHEFFSDSNGTSMWKIGVEVSLCGAGNSSWMEWKKATWRNTDGAGLGK